MTRFYDSATWSAKPDVFSYVALYADGRYAVAGSDPITRVPHRRWITVTGDMPHAGIGDYEPGNSLFHEDGKLRIWASMRLAEHRSVPIIYCDRANLHLALNEIGRLPRLWWIPTLDNREWTPDELSDNIAQEYGIVIPPYEIWANQFTDRSGEFDISNLFGNFYA